MAPLRLNGSTSGYSQIDAPAVAGDQTFTLPGTGGTLDRLNRAGNVLQVVNATYGFQVSSTANTYTDSGLSASITPSATSSKILVLVSHPSIQRSAANNYAAIVLLRGASIIETLNAQFLYTNTSLLFEGAIHHTYLDSPGSTSSLTYKTQFKNGAATGTIFLNAGGGNSTITLMEIAA